MYDCPLLCDQRIQFLPCFKTVKGILHSSLVVFHHVGVHIWIVATNVPLSAPIGNRAESEGWVMLLRFLKLGIRNMRLIRYGALNYIVDITCNGKN